MHVSHDVDLTETPKFRRTCVRIGCSPRDLLWYLHHLWAKALRQRRDGILRGWALVDIGIACDAEDPAKVADGLLAEGWISLYSKRQRKTTYCIHDFLKHQAYARKSLYDKERYESESTGNPHGVHVEKNGVHRTPTPTPTPSPSPTPSHKESARSRGAGRAEKVVSVFQHYRKHHPRSFPNPRSTMKEWRKIRDRLEEGYTVAQLCAAIDGCHRSKFHSGDNENGKRYHALELIVRDATHVESFLDVAENRNREVKLSPGIQAEIDAGKTTLEEVMKEVGL